MELSPYTVQIKKRGKVYFPGQEITKGELIDYYNQVADYLLPYLKNRPLTLHRFPNGIGEEGFYQKTRPAHFPNWIDSLEVESRDRGSTRYIMCNNKSTLAYLVNQGCVEFHPWLSTNSNIHYPDRIIFDLDPPANNFDQAVKGAMILRGFLEDELGLHAYPMLTGSAGIHVISPLRPTQRFEEVRSFARNVADYLARLEPEYFTSSLPKKQRGGKLFLDYLRNSFAQTAIVPFSVRALPNAPVAAPVEWDELGSRYRSSQSFNIKNIGKRLEQAEQVWRKFHNHAKKLDYRIEQLNEMVA